MEHTRVFFKAMWQQMDSHKYWRINIRQVSFRNTCCSMKKGCVSHVLEESYYYYIKMDEFLMLKEKNPTIYK